MKLRCTKKCASFFAPPCILGVTVHRIPYRVRRRGFYMLLFDETDEIVLCCRSPYKPESGIRSFLMMPAEDFEEFDILPYLLEAIAFLSRAETSGGCAFVHCSYGVNRSGVVAAAYLMVSERKPLLQVTNELKAKRSLVLSNVGFRRQLVKFARCRGLLDRVERPSRRSPRLECGGDQTARGATPSMDRNKNGTEEEPNGGGGVPADSPAETCSAKEALSSSENGEPPPKNGYRVLPPVVTVSTADLERNGLPSNGFAPRLRQTTSRRERLLQDVDSTIEAISVRDSTDIESAYYTSYRPRGDIERVPSPAFQLYEQHRPSTYLDYMDRAPASPLLTHFNVLEQPRSSDSDRPFTASAVDSALGVYSYGNPRKNAILDEYFEYKSTPSVSPHVVHSAVPVETYLSAVKPPYSYSRSSDAAISSVIDDYEEANMGSFLAQRDARRPRPLSRRRPDHAVDSADLRRRSVSSLDAVLPHPRSTGKLSGSAGAARSAEIGSLLPASAYVGRWYPGTSSTPGRRYSNINSHSAYVAGMTSFDADVNDEPVLGHTMGSLGRTVATRVTPAPGYGPRSGYARSQSVSRFIY